MNQLRRILQSLSWTQRIWLMVAAVAVAGGISLFTNWNRERDFKPLFSGLDAEDAGALVAQLKATSVEYRLADNGTAVLVPSALVDETRLTLASAGLPKSGRVGYELFDKANLGASEFTEQVNYHRAIEGELERTVMTIREVERARVHITLAKDSLYSESKELAKASVLVKLRPGARLSAQSVAAICQLTASAVPELSPDQVSLVDTSGNLLNRARRASAPDGSDDSEATLEYRKGVEKDVQAKMIATLEPLLGADHFRANVSADVDLTSGEQSEENYDPQKSATLSSQTSEDGPALPAASGVPGTASNLPRPTANAAAVTSGTNNFARKVQNTTYQPSRMVKHTKFPHGTVKRLSLSVLVDHSVRFENTKRIVEAPSAEKLKVIQDLVAAAVGVDMNRGDQLVVEAFPFESTLTAEPPVFSGPAPAAPGGSLPLPPFLQKLVGTKNFLLITGIGAGAALLLFGGLISVLVRRSGKKKIRAEAGAAIEGGTTKELAPTPEDMQRQMEAQMAEQAAQQARAQAEELMKLKLPAVSTKKTEVLTKHISGETKKDPIAMAQVVRSWLNG